MHFRQARFRPCTPSLTPVRTEGSPLQRRWQLRMNAEPGHQLDLRQTSTPAAANPPPQVKDLFRRLPTIHASLHGARCTDRGLPESLNLGFAGPALASTAELLEAPIHTQRYPAILRCLPLIQACPVGGEGWSWPSPRASACWPSFLPGGVLHRRCRSSAATATTRGA